MWSHRAGWWGGAAAFVLGLAGPAPAHAQTGDDGHGEASRVARADSIRAAMAQPAGDRDGLTPMGALLAPFRLAGDVLSFPYAVGHLAYEILDAAGVVQPARKALEESGAPAGPPADLQVEPRFIGSRSWPALVGTYRGLAPLFAQAGYSLRGYELYSGGLRFDEADRGMEVSATYRNLRELHFWGVGTGTPAADRSDYADERWIVGATAWSRLAGPLRLDVGAAWEEDAVGPGFDAARPDVSETFDTDTLFGFGRRTRFLRWEATLDVDLTSVAGLQNRGVRVIADYRFHQGVDGTDARFHRVAADVRGYLPVDRRHALALRLLAEDHLGESGEGVPFTHLARLGDDEGLRGYSSRRFRDLALAAVSAEWRYAVWWHPGDPAFRVDGFAFVDHGTVASTLGRLGEARFRTTPGLGLRLTHRGDALLETFVAFGGDATRMHVSLGATF